ncbi:MAG TPA: decaprenylphospho-beta-D-erythro-pentofuranosid-2-ulose 2-reductase [Acidimicrobiales bacterium]|nr:decaprenylphospho-beta-D-erythro-pentofuranosid-2-ulose 2-reductase [Acidimicrobiales bacterium]
MKDALGAVQSILVLGGGSDIALATVHKLVARRCRTVVLAARRPEALDDDITRLRDAGADTVEAVAFDATAFDSHDELVAGLWRRFGDFDVVMVAFGVLGDQAHFADCPADAVQAAQANYTGAVSMGLRVARMLEEQGHGTLVFLSSVAGERVRADNVVYGSSKAGLDAFAQGLDLSLAGTGVRVVIVRPGFVATKMTTGMRPAPFSTTADAVADAVVAGIARGAAVVYAPSVLRWVMAVLRHLPRPLWQRVSALQSR